MVFLAAYDSSRLSEELFNFLHTQKFCHISQIDQFPFLIAFRPQRSAPINKAGNRSIEQCDTNGVGQEQPRMLRWAPKILVQEQSGLPHTLSPGFAGQDFCMDVEIQRL